MKLTKKNYKCIHIKFLFQLRIFSSFKKIIVLKINQGLLNQCSKQKNSLIRKLQSIEYLLLRLFNLKQSLNRLCTNYYKKIEVEFSIKSKNKKQAFV